MSNPVSGPVTPRYRLRWAATAQDRAAFLALRARVFRASADASAHGPWPSDEDDLDAACRYLLIESADSAQSPVCPDDPARPALMGGFRLLDIPDHAALARSYTARRYDLAALAAPAPGQNPAGGRFPMAEIGRFCLDPACRDGDVLRLAWAALAQLVEGQGLRMLIGCASFRGTDPGAHAQALAYLGAQALAPAAWRPGPRAPEIWALPHPACAAPPAAGGGDLRAAMAGLPPLLRFYLGLGGRVSDHAVIDRDLGTLHVFTGLEIAAIPPARLRSLRAAAQAVAAPH